MSSQEHYLQMTVELTQQTMHFLRCPVARGLDANQVGC
jgi:hypothetical protein